MGDLDDLVIGIDLGTTNSCVSYYFKNKVKILENCYGDKITPSFIYYLDLKSDTTLVGKDAKKKPNKPELGIYGIKRLVGRKFDDNSLNENLDYFLFEVEADNSNNPIVVLSQQNTTIRRTPQELCTIILKKLKHDAEEKLGPLKKVVITVPAYFNVRQREVTLAAAEDAGFTVLKLLNEPTAAALSFYHEFDFDEDNYFLVYDLGGGTFDVAVLKRVKSDIKIVGVAGDMWLGGQDFDNLIADYVCLEVENRYGCNLKAENRRNDLRRIYNKCEEAKKELTSAEETLIILNGIVDGHPSVEIALTRNHMNKMCDKLFEKTIRIVDVCLKSSKVRKEDIKQVILAGGSTRIRRIEEIIRDYFDRNVLNRSVNRDECVAEGAAIQAAMLSTNKHQKIAKIKLVDVVPLSLGIADFVDRMDFIIKRNTKIPVRKTVSYTTYELNQESIYLRVFEGERLNAKKNRLLGDLTISDITPAPPGKCKIMVTMSVDQNSILTVTAKETYSDNVKELKVNYLKGGKSEIEIYDFLTDAATNKKEDEIFDRFSRYKAYLLQYCSGIIYNLLTKKLARKYKIIYDECSRIKEKESEADVEDEERIRKHIESMELFCEPIVKDNQFEFMPTKI